MPSHGVVWAQSEALKQFIPCTYASSLGDAVLVKLLQFSKLHEILPNATLELITFSPHLQCSMEHSIRNLHLRGRDTGREPGVLILDAG